MKMFKKIISLSICIFFAINNTVYPLGVAPGTQNPKIVDAFEAAGKKLFAAKWEECPVDFESYTRPQNFIGEPNYMPQGVSEIMQADYENMPGSWKESTFFKEVLYKDNNYKKIVSGNIEEIEKLLVDAFKYYRTNEAKIPAGLVDVKIRDFPVKEENGEVPISRIEKYKDGKYALVIHPKFAGMWADILKNDKWIKYDGLESRNDPEKEKQTRYVSMAWGIFYRIAKHEMTDLDSITGKRKDSRYSHLTWYTGALYGETLVESKSEEAANTLAGNYAEINDAIWLWFLGSYCFGDPVRYNNKIFEKRIDWIFDHPDAKDKELDAEFQGLRKNKESRDWAKSLALNVNFSYFSDYSDLPDYSDFSAENWDMQDIGVMGRKQKNVYIFRKIIAGYLVNSLKKNKKEQKNLEEDIDKVIKIVQNNLPEYAAAVFMYSIENNGAVPVKASDIELYMDIDSGLGIGSDLVKTDKDLKKILTLLAIRMVAKAIHDNFLDMKEKIIAPEAKFKVRQYVKDAFYHYLGTVSLSRNGTEAKKAIKGFVEGLNRENNVIDSFPATGIDETDYEGHLDLIFLLIVSSDHLRKIMNSKGYFTIRNLFSADDIDLPQGYTLADAEKDLGAMAEKKWYKVVDTGEDKGYARTKRGAEPLYKTFGVEKGILDRGVDYPGLGLEEGEISFLKEHDILTVRDLVLLSRDDIRAMDGIFKTVSVKGATVEDYIKNIVEALHRVGFNLIYYGNRSPKDWKPSILVLYLDNLYSLIGKSAADYLMDNGIVTFRNLISKTENEVKGKIYEFVSLTQPSFRKAEKETNKIMKKLKDWLDKAGLSMANLEESHNIVKQADDSAGDKNNSIELRELKRSKSRRKKDGRKKTGRSPGEAMFVIENSRHIQNKINTEGSFTLEDYMIGYEEIRKQQINRDNEIVFSTLPKKENDSQSRRDLKALETIGRLIVDRTGKSHRYALPGPAMIDRDIIVDNISNGSDKNDAVSNTAVQDKTLEEVISEYVVNIEKKWPGAVFDLNRELETAIERTVNLAHETDIEILLPAASIKLSNEMESAIERMNKIMSQNGSKISVNEYYGPANFFRHLADKKDGAKKIAIIDAQTSEYMNKFCQEKIPMSQMNKFEIFRNIRMLKVLDLDPSSDAQNGAVYQSQLLMTAILARLIEEGDDHFLDIKSLLMELLDGTFLNGGNGRVKMDEFINNLAEREDDTTSFDRIRNKVKYFVSEGRAISLIRTLQREIRMMQYFWTFA